MKNDFALNPIDLNNGGWKLQQNLPTKTTKEIPVGSQIQKNVLSGLAQNLDKSFLLNDKEVTGQVVYDRINEVIGELSSRGLQDFESLLDIDKDGVIQEPSKLYNLLLEEARSKNLDLNLVKALEKEVSIYGIPQAHQKMMNMFYSAANNRIVKVKTNGASLIQVSNYGLDRNAAMGQDGVKWLIDPETGLKPPTIEDKQFTEAELASYNRALAEIQDDKSRLEAHYQALETADAVPA